MLLRKLSLELSQIKQQHHTVQQFLNIAKLELDDSSELMLDWRFDIMSYNDYKNDSRSFPPIRTIGEIVIKQSGSNIDRVILFVIYKKTSSNDLSAGGLATPLSESSLPFQTALSLEIQDLYKVN